MGQRDGSLGLETFRYVHSDPKGNLFSIVRAGNDEWIIFAGDKGDAGKDTGCGAGTLAKCRRIIDGW